MSRAFRGILTGFGMAAIKNKEAKDNAKMEVVKAAGLDYYTNQLPEHKKREANRAEAYNQLTKILGSEEAADYFDANDFITGDGKDVERITKMLEDKDIKPDAFKNYIPTENYSDRYNQRQSDFESRFDMVKNTFNMQGSGIGPSTIEGLLTKPQGDLTRTIKGEPGSQVGPVVTEGTPDREEKIDRTTSSLPISAFYADKPDVRGVETKFKQIKDTVIESYGYGDSYTTIDGRIEFRLSGAKRNEGNAHIALAENFSKNRPDINQLEAATLAKQELDRQVFTPFKIIESSLKDMKYLPGDGQTGKAVMGNVGQNIDAATTMVGNVSIYEFITDIYNNDLLQDGAGNVNSAVFAKFAENIPVNIMYEGESLKSVLQNAHQMQYFNRFQ